jgi:hypothetical protein
MALQKVIRELIADSAIDATRLDVEGNGSVGQALVSSGDGSFQWGASDQLASSIFVQNFNGDGIETSFALNNELIDEVQSFVYFDGVYQSKTNYSLSGQSLVFNTPPASGVSIEVMSIGAIAITEDPSNYVTHEQAIAYAIALG